jgi:hypothetical protein
MPRIVRKWNCAVASADNPGPVILSIARFSRGSAEQAFCSCRPTWALSSADHCHRASECCTRATSLSLDKCDAVQTFRTSATVAARESRHARSCGSGRFSNTCAAPSHPTPCWWTNAVCGCSPPSCPKPTAEARARRSMTVSTSWSRRRAGLSINGSPDRCRSRPSRMKSGRLLFICAARSAARPARRFIATSRASACDAPSNASDGTKSISAISRSSSASIHTATSRPHSGANSGSPRRFAEAGSERRICADRLQVAEYSSRRFLDVAHHP